MTKNIVTQRYRSLSIEWRLATTNTGMLTRTSTFLIYIKLIYIAFNSDEGLFNP